MTATLCAMLVEEGRLRWDTRVGDVFPDLKARFDAKFQSVTLEQLLCHRAGLPDDHSPDLTLFAKLATLKGGPAAQRREMIELVLSRPPAFEPGSKFAYSNHGFSIAGAMCEKVTGQSFESLLTTRLFEPLDMKTAGFGPPGSANKVDQPRGHAKLLGWYSAIPPGPGADNPECMTPAGRVHCSIGDWAKYAALHLDAARGKPRLLKAESFKKLHSDPYHQDYGFGWAMGKPDWSKGTILGHDGSNTKWYASIMIAPAENIAVVVAINAASDNAQKACAETRKALRDRFLPNASASKR